MAELHWFPTYVADWLSSAGVSQMLPEQEGAYWHLLLLAWGDGTEPPTLPSDDKALAAMSRLGQRWKRLGPLIRSQFDEINGRLVNAKQMAVWTEQQGRYERLASAGKRGGEAKAKKKRGPGDASGDAVAESLAIAKQSELEEAVEAPSGLLPASAPAGALGVEAPRAPAQAAQINNGSTGPWRDPSPPDPDAERLNAEYFARLNARVDQWAADNPDDALELEKTLRTEMGLPHARELSGFQKTALRERYLVEVREQRGWPDCDEWIALEKARLVAADAQTSEVAA